MAAPKLSEWIGHHRHRETEVDARQAALLAATLDVDAPQSGDPLPPLWHWAAAEQPVPTSNLGHDGHEKKGGFLPPVPLPRRMWAGGSLEFAGILRVDQPLVQDSVVSQVIEKQARSGPMVLVSVDHTLTGATGRIKERHNIVFLQSPDRYSPPPPIPPMQDPVIDQAYPMNTTRLFRYSACTFNGHRIHYDLDFARQIERYPNLLVHGPLQATLMIAAATSHMGRCPDRFEYRAVHPMFPDAPVRILARPCEGGLHMCTARGTEHQGMQATAMWTDASTVDDALRPDH
jgi:3-methylfumaryl-CoA hydratase